MTRRLLLLPLFLVVGCAHQRLSGSELDKVARPAFISRIEVEAGPHSRVFREDGGYQAKLKKLESPEADRRLQAKLARVTRFEVSERLRVNTLAKLPQERPWTATVDPAQVATVLESFLVEEVPANAPDYDLLGWLKADTIVEFVVQDYGMRSNGGRAGLYLKGYGRMFWLKGRREIWRKPFQVDRVAEGAEHLDPFKVGKDPELFREAITLALDQVAEDFAQELNPPDRRGSAPPEEALPSTPDANPPPAQQPRPIATPQEELAPGELPDPDP